MGDWVIASCIALISCAVLLWPLVSGGDAERLIISVDGVVVYDAPLIHDATINAGAKNVLIARGGAVTMERAECPDGLCLHMRASRAGDSVVCLPNRVVARIISKEALDSVVY